ncbi:MAG: methyltransferase [Chloroflexi bacterium]|nr:methyltransferase [Chloroflexota bacterium]
MNSNASHARAGLLQLVNGFEVSRAIQVAATLGLADLMLERPQTLAELANASGTHAPSLYRLMRALTNVGVFAESSEGEFSLTLQGEWLRSDLPDSVRFWAIATGSPSFWASWGDLEQTIQTGEAAFPRVHGVSNWSYRAHNRRAGAEFDAAMASNSAAVAATIAETYPFSQFNTVADIGGGRGALISAVLMTHPHLRGLLFDQPHVVAGASPLLERAGVLDRCEVIGGNFLESVPGGADVYVLKNIASDWDDATATRILENCRTAMHDQARVVLVEPVLDRHSHPNLAVFSDLRMLVMNGGRARTCVEFERLFASAGLHFERMFRTDSPLHVLEARPA